MEVPADHTSSERNRGYNFVHDERVWTFFMWCIHFHHVRGERRKAKNITTFDLSHLCRRLLLSLQRCCCLKPSLMLGDWVYCHLPSPRVSQASSGTEFSSRGMFILQPPTAPRRTAHHHTLILLEFLVDSACARPPLPRAFQGER